MSRRRPDDSVGLTAVRFQQPDPGVPFSRCAAFSMPSDVLSLVNQLLSFWFEQWLNGWPHWAVRVAQTNRPVRVTVGIASNGTASRRRIRRFASSPTPLALQIYARPYHRYPCASGAVRQRCSLTTHERSWASSPASLLSSSLQARSLRLLRTTKISVGNIFAAASLRIRRRRRVFRGTALQLTGAERAVLGGVTANENASSGGEAVSVWVLLRRKHCCSWLLHGRG